MLGTYEDREPFGGKRLAHISLEASDIKNTECVVEKTKKLFKFYYQGKIGYNTDILSFLNKIAVTEGINFTLRNATINLLKKIDEKKNNVRKEYESQYDLETSLATINFEIADLTDNHWNVSNTLLRDIYTNPTVSDINVHIDAMFTLITMFGFDQTVDVIKALKRY